MEPFNQICVSFDVDVDSSDVNVILAYHWQPTGTLSIPLALSCLFLSSLTADLSAPSFDELMNSSPWFSDPSLPLLPFTPLPYAA